MNIDQEIRKALEVDNEEVQLARLEQYWNVRSQQQLRRSRLLRALPLAAAASIGVVSLAVVWNWADDAKTLRVAQESASPNEAIGSIESHQSQSEETSPLRAYAGRAPTAYERFMFAARTSRQPRQTSVAEQVDNVIERLTLSPEIDTNKLLDQVNLDPINAEAVLLRRLAHANVAEQVVMLRLLSVCGTARSLSALIRLGKRDPIRNEVLTTIEGIVGLEGLTRVALSSTDPALQAALALKLLNADSEPALLAYLSLVQNVDTRSIALRTADAAELPVDRLLRVLDHENRQVRFAAAVVLGHVNGPVVTERLIELVTQRPGGSTEAWMALLACRGELAEEFFQYAERSPQLLGHVNNARLRWAQLFL